MAALRRGRNKGKQGRHRVASIAFDSSGSRDAAKPPISLHPAFPAVVALWFAALLGLGSMVLPVALIDRVVAISGFSTLVPAAQPPLGFMARGLIALADLLDRRGDWSAMREAGQAHVVERHDWARNVRRYQPVYQALLSTPAHGCLPAAA